MFSVSLELELCGPQLTLLISRYKFASEVQEKIKFAETRYLKALDNILNDSYRLDWADIGSSASNESQHDLAPVSAIDSEIESLDPEEDSIHLPEGAMKSSVSDESSNSVTSRLTSDCKTMAFGAEQANRDRIEMTMGCNELKRSLASRKNMHKSTKGTLKLDSNKCNSLKATQNNYQMLGYDLSNIDLSTKEKLPVKNQLALDGIIHTYESLKTKKPDPKSTKQSFNCSNLLVVKPHKIPPTRTSVAVVGKYQRRKTGGQTFTESWTTTEEEVYDCNEIGMLRSKKKESKCVCGIQHGTKQSTFWMQCESCKLWFHAYSFCIGFASSEAPYIEKWNCQKCTTSVPTKKRQRDH